MPRLPIGSLIRPPPGSVPRLAWGLPPLAWPALLAGLAVALGVLIEARQPVNGQVPAPGEPVVGSEMLLQAVWRRGDVVIFDLPADAQGRWTRQGAGGLVVEMTPLDDGRAVVQVESLAERMLTFEVDFGDLIVRTEITPRPPD